MRKLNKLKLKDFDAMSDSDMKNVIGGFRSTMACKKTCKSHADCSSYCVRMDGKLCCL